MKRLLVLCVIAVFAACAPPSPEGEGLSPSAITLAPGRTRGFVFDLPGEVRWSVSGQTSRDTAINEGGFLRIGSNETARHIIVRASLVSDASVFATSVVTVNESSIIDGLTRGLDFDRYPRLREVYADYFLIGAAGDGGIGIGSFVNTETAPRGALIAHHFNAWTFENSMKPQPLRGVNPANALQSRDEWQGFAHPTSTMNAARDKYHGMAIIGHTLAWHSQSPAWMWDRHDGGAADRDTALRNMQHHIIEVMEQWGGQLQAMDVVNEAIGSVFPDDPRDWRRALSRGEGWYPTLGYGWVEYAFIFAAEVADRRGYAVRLYYNEFLLHTANKGLAVYEMIKDINERHAASLIRHPVTGEPFRRPDGRLLIEGVGMQDRQSGVLDIEGFSTAIRRFASLGLYVSITEMDLPWRITQADGMLTSAEEIAQAQEYARFFAMLRRYAAGPATAGSPYPRVIERVTFWGIDDQQSWAPGQPMVFNAPFEGRITGKEALLAVLDPIRYLEMHPWTPPPSVAVPGVYVFDLAADGFTGMNIILGSGADQWPWSTSGDDGRTAFSPQPGVRYRLAVRYQMLGTFGLETHWLVDNSFNNFTRESFLAASAMQTYSSGQTALSIPARFHAGAGAVGGSFAYLHAEFTMPAAAQPDGLVGNIALRGINLGHEVVFYSVTIHRLGGDGESDTLLVNWPELVPAAPRIPGIIVPDHDGTGGRADIIIGSGRGVWPYADAHESGRAFVPEAGVTYRLMFNVTTVGAGGWRVRWLPGTGGEDYTTADSTVTNAHPFRVSAFGLGVPAPYLIPYIPIASVIPSHSNQGISAAGVYTIVQDITLDGNERYQGLIGNIAFRGIGGSGNFIVNWITIERLAGGPGSMAEELLAFHPFGVSAFDDFVNNFETFSAYFPANPLNVGTGANMVTAAITRSAGHTAVDADNPPVVGDILVASITAGSAPTAPLLRAGTTMGVLAGNVTYTWKVGAGDGLRIVQSGSDNTFAVDAAHTGEVISVEITSDWETGVLTGIGGAVIAANGE